jgi:hypothetical protein
LSVGFNYDLLRSLTDVNFQYPVGYFGFGMPIETPNLLPEGVMDDVFSEESGVFRNPGNYRPSAIAGMNPNYTIRVDVPMVGGVGSFAYTQNFAFGFSTALGGSSAIFGSLDIGEQAAENGVEGVSGFLSLKGALRLPLSVNMGWETMTFGYAYRVNNNDNLVFAFNMHRHLFALDMRLRADIDLLGHVSLQADNIDIGSGATTSLNIDEELVNFHSAKCNGSAQAKYRVEAWTPSFGARWGRLSYNGRLGMSALAKGSARGGFVVPSLVNLETGKVDLLENFGDYADNLANDPLYVFDMIGDDGVIPKTVDSVVYIIGDRKMRWEMPQGHTFAVYIIPERISVSYTKTWGNGISMKIEDIYRQTSVESQDGGSWLGSDNDTLVVDVGVKIDNIIMFQVNYPSFFMNLGVCGVDAWTGDKYGNRNYALSDLEGLNGLRFGDVVMILPVFSFGVNLGTKLQLRLEADVLPLPAFRTGVNYYF